MQKGLKQQQQQQKDHSETGRRLKFMALICFLLLLLLASFPIEKVSNLLNLHLKKHFRVCAGK